MPDRQVPRPPIRLLRTAVAALAGLAVLLVGCSGAPDTDRPADAVRASTQDQQVVLQVGGLNRGYLLQPARGLPPGDMAAVVVVLHQEGGTAEGVAAETGLQELRERGATLVYPSGYDHSWDAGKCCGKPATERIDDLAFLDRVLADVAVRTPVDSRRRALVGYSSGGMLTYQYVCHRPGTLAAAVIVSGSLESACGNGLAVPDMLAVHGELDGTIGLTRPVFVRRLGLAPRPVVSTLSALTRSAGCKPVARSVRTTAGEVRTWSGCRGGPVQARLLSDAGHGWGALGASRSTREFLAERLLDD